MSDIVIPETEEDDCSKGDDAIDRVLTKVVKVVDDVELGAFAVAENNDYGLENGFF